MKIYRPLVVLLLAFICGLTVSAQDSSEITSLRAKAVKGNGIAQYNLGLAYAEGHGVATDPIEAFVWLSLARENGARGRALDNIVGSLDKAAYATAQKRLAERKAELGHRPSTVTSTPAPATGETPTAPDTKPAAAAVLTPVQPATPSEDPALARLRTERETLSAQVADLTGTVTALRAERERLVKLSADREKADREAAEAVKAELERTKQSLAALQQAPKPAADTTALDQRTRELQATRAELEASRNFGTQVESSLNKVTDQKTALETQLAASATEANRARQEATALAQAKEAAQQKLNAVTAEHTALQSEVAQFRQRPAAPAYPDLSGRVRELESSLADTQRQLAVKPAAPKYPDLSGRVHELESSLADAQHQLAAKPAAPAYPDLSGRVTELEKQLTTVSAEASQTKQAAQAEALLLGQKLKQTEVARQQTQESYTALQAEAGKLRARPATPAYPDLSGRVAELETALAAARKPVTPAYPDLSDRVREQERQAEALRATVAASAQELADTRGKLAAMSAGLSTAASAKADAQAQAAALTKARDEAQQQLNAIAAEHTALQSEVAQLRQRPVAPAYPDLSGRVAELETTLAAAAAAKPAAPGYPDLSGKVGELEAALATATQKAGATEQARAEVAKQFDDFKSSTITAQRERTTLLAQVKMLESDKAALRRQAEAATAETGQLRSQVAALKIQQVAIKPAAPAYPDLSGKVGALEAQVGNLTAALAAKPVAPAYPDLSGRVSELEGQLAQARQPATPKYPDLSGRVSELEAQVSSDKSAIASANEEAARTRQEATVLAQAKAAAQTQAADLTTERDSARSAQTELRGTIAKLTEEKAQLAAASKAAPAYPDLHDRVVTLESDLAASQKALAAKPAAPTYPDLSNRVGELEAALAAAGTSGRQGAAGLNTANEQIAQLKSALAAKPAAPGYPDLSGRVSELEGQLAQARQPVAPTYPDLSGRVSELETALTTARNAAPAYPDLSGRVTELEAALVAAKNAAPAYPDLSAKASELEAKLATEEKSAAGRIKDLETQVASLQGPRAAKGDTTDPWGKVVELETKLAAAEKSAAAKPAAPAYPDLSSRVADLTGEVAQLRADRERMQKLLADAATHARPVAPPGYLDRVRELETALAQAKEAAKLAVLAYPDLSGRVRELEAAVADSARQLIAAEAAQTGLKQQLAGTNTALQNAAKGGDDSAKLRRERDELSGRVTDLASEVAQVRADRERMQKMLADAGRQLRDNTADAARIKDLETQQAGLQGSLAAAQAQANELKSALAARNGAPAYPDLSGKVSELESKLAAAENASATKPAAPAYPDLSGRVHELETQVATLANIPRGRAPAYPDLSGRVNELEAALAEARQRPAVASTSSAPAAGGDSSELQKKLADTEDRLATSLRGYAMLEKERNEVTVSAGKATETVTAEKNALAAQVTTLSGEVAQLRAGAQSSAGSTQAEIARLNEALTALQRSTAQNSADLATTRALAQQLQGANAVLAGENYRLKTMLSRTGNPPDTVASAPAAVPASRTHVVASGDSLSRLSQRYYGTANRWQEIYNANTDRIGANGLLRIGTELRIP
jgi:chromosome segregation ATPase